MDADKEPQASLSMVGKRIKLIVRQPNGQTSVFTGVMVAMDELSIRIKTDRGEDRTEPRLYSAVEVL